MNVYKVTSKRSGTVIGYYESYDLADFHCTERLYEIEEIGIISKTDMIQVMLDLPDQRKKKTVQEKCNKCDGEFVLNEPHHDCDFSANDEIYPDFIKTLEGLGQQSLIELFFDWYDADQHNTSKSTQAKLYEIRKRIPIKSTTGIKEKEE